MCYCVSHPTIGLLQVRDIVSGVKTRHILSLPRQPVVYQCQVIIVLLRKVSWGLDSVVVNHMLVTAATPASNSGMGVWQGSPYERCQSK